MQFKSLTFFNRKPKKETGKERRMRLLNGSVTAIQFQDQNHLISSSDTDGLIKVWDLRRSYSFYKGPPQAKFVIPYPGKSNFQGYTSLALNSSKTHLYASCKDHHIYQFDLASYDEKAQRAFSGYDNGSKFFIRMSLSHDDQFLACGSSDQYAYIWHTSPSAPNEPIYRLTGHENFDDPDNLCPVTCVEWSKTEWKLATCADDFTHRIWRIQDFPHSDYTNETDIDSEICVGKAEKVDNVQYPQKTDYKITNFFSKSESKENDDEDELLMPCPKKPRNRSPFKNLQLKSPNCPKKMLSNLPCSWDLLTSPSKRKDTSPRKLLISPRKLTISPRKLFSPTANLPNFVVDGKSPHNVAQSSGKKGKVDWLTSLRRSKKDDPSGSPKGSPKGSLKRKRAKKSLDMNV